MALRSLLTMLFAGFATSTAFTQGVTGTISGVVKDSQNTAVPGAAATRRFRASRLSQSSPRTSQPRVPLLRPLSLRRNP